MSLRTGRAGLRVTPCADQLHGPKYDQKDDQEHDGVVRQFLTSIPARRPTTKSA
jgi:hypothetical protein